MNVGYIENGDYIKVKGVAFGTGATSFSARVASGHVRRHASSCVSAAPTALSSGRAPFPAPAAGRPGRPSPAPVSGATGTQDLYLRFTGGSGSLFNVNWWQFAGS